MAGDGKRNPGPCPAEYMIIASGLMVSVVPVEGQVAEP
jgi:hypothetical protein